MRQYTSKEFIRICVANGFQYDRSKGDHAILINNEGKHISIPETLNSCIARRLIKENNLETDIKKIKRERRMDNLPPGAANDIRAPYNEPLNKEHRRFVSVTISYYDSAYLPEDATEEQIKDELFSHVYNSKIPKKYDIDEFIMLDD